VASRDIERPEQASPATEPDIPRASLGLLLQQRCIDTLLYLQHDLTISELAKAIGTNRSYLSLYFSSQHTTYNAYINDLRINHFKSLSEVYQTLSVFFHFSIKSLSQ
jgi:AraC-like DNA-binding protein